MIRINEVLKTKGLKQIHLAEALGVSRSSVSQWCSGKVDIPVSKLKAISDAIDCDIRELLVSTKKATV